jgi:hypothetical protein
MAHTTFAIKNNVMPIQTKPDQARRKPPRRFCISLCMRAAVSLPVILSLAMLLAGGCNGSGPLGGSNSPNGDAGDQGSQKQQPQHKPGQSGMEETQPAASVTGKPSADSDRGSPSAVGHRSVAEPGAPQGTDTPPPRQPAPKSPQH